MWLGDVRLECVVDHRYTCVSEDHTDGLLPCYTLMWSSIWSIQTGFFKTLWCPPWSHPGPWDEVILPLSCGQSQAGTLRRCLSSPSRQGTEGLGFTVPWRKCSGSCQPKANWKSPPTVFNLLIKAAADLIVIPNRSALSFPRLLLSPLLAWLVAMI